MTEMQALVEPTLAGKRILVVEDDRMLALYDADLLEAWHCDVLGPAASVADALAIIDDTAPDAALLDVSLGGETSEPIARALTAIRRPFVVTTAFAPRHLGPALRTAPILSKPVSETRLRRVLTQLLAPSRSD
jgi:CheY-like chemotaxis protein